MTSRVFKGFLWIMDYGPPYRHAFYPESHTHADPPPPLMTRDVICEWLPNYSKSPNLL